MPVDPIRHEFEPTMINQPSHGHGPSSSHDEDDPLMEIVSAPEMELEEEVELAAPPARDFLEHFDLKENPFSDSVNPDFFYRTENHDRTLRQMLMSVKYDISLAMVTGPSGTGKTLITQLLVQQLDPARYQPVLVLVSPGMSKTGILREILSELNVALPAGINRTQDLLKLLSNYIIDLYHEDRKLVLIIDECHFLNADNLHVLRTISNIEVPERKLSTCLLFGEERFAQRIEHPSYASLRNRMYMRCALAPMTETDCAQYIKFRLLVAGYRGELFDATAMAKIHEHSEGVCRNVNKLAMLSLMEGFMSGKPRIDGATVQACVDRM